MTDTFEWRADLATSGGGDFGVFQSKFGDGYSQDVPNGINNETQTWSVSISGYGDKVQPIIDFIRSHTGKSFFWKAPFTAAPGYYKCKKWGCNDQGGAYFTLTLQFEQGYMP